MSSNHQWLKFWPQDWQRDPALRSCGIAARGIWIDMLCIMHEGAPYGHLTIGGKPATVRQVGMVTGCGEKEAAKLIAELEDAGVFSRTDDGTIFSRRMVRDKTASDAGRENGKHGGNPALKGAKREKVNGGGNPGGLTPPPTGGPNTKKKEAEERDSDLRSAPGGAGPPDARAQLWSTGLAQFRALTGKSDPQSRRALGGLLKSAGDDCGLVNAALAEASDLRPIDAMAWLTRRIRGPDEFRNGFLQLIATEGMPSADPVTAFLEGPHGKPH